MGATYFPLFVRDFEHRTLCLTVSPSSTLMDVKSLIFERSCVPAEVQVLDFRTQQSPFCTLQELGFTANSTLHLTARLRGGKGGFGSLLRGSGKSTQTDNEDACRDLSGRRIRFANAEKKLKEWAANEQQRKHQSQLVEKERERVKAERRAEAVQIDIEAVKEDQRKSLLLVTKSLQNSIAAGTKRAAAVTPKAVAKKPRYSSEPDSEEDDIGSESENDSQTAALEVPTSNNLVTPAQPPETTGVSV